MIADTADFVVLALLGGTAAGSAWGFGLALLGVALA